MTFIPPRNLRMLERSIQVRQELIGFLALATVWGLLVNLLAGALFALLHPIFARLWNSYSLWLVLLLVAAVVIVGYFALLFLARGLLGSVDDVRKFTIVMPVMAYADRLEVLALRDYWFSRSISQRVGQVDCRELFESYLAGVQKNRGRPFTGKLHQILAGTLADEMAASLAESCEFLLSENSQFHGVDYFSLAKPAGPSPQSAVLGMPDHKIRLPPRYVARVATSAPDRYGKATKEILIEGPSAVVRFGVWPQWALLSNDYHARSLSLAKQLLVTETQHYSERNANSPPTLWVLEIPMEIRVRYGNRWNPFFFLTDRFEVFASWLCDLLDRVEQRWSWEYFVQTISEPPRAKPEIPASTAST